MAKFGNAFGTRLLPQRMSFVGLFALGGRKVQLCQPLNRSRQYAMPFPNLRRNASSIQALVKRLMSRCLNERVVTRPGSCDFAEDCGRAVRKRLMGSATWLFIFLKNLGGVAWPLRATP